ncbi:uncharacterized protein LOC124925182 [Impatiens glandulifera]|uniref:uncharacterized protein LOC124925182 n=1 Tax=Impatiens glandulifera TaxID=253017 RepID=UPI001FB069C2|nr:uncharacterized protein LOC124925182 [Impatiens glandulifera]
MTSRKNNIVDDSLPPEVVKNMMKHCPEFGDLNYEELLQHQESVFQSLKGIEIERGSTSETKSMSHDEEHGNFNWEKDESSKRLSIDSQLALDEALARSLQDMEDGFANLTAVHEPPSQHNNFHPEVHNHPAVEQEEDVANQDNISIREEVQSPVVGTENISKLQTIIDKFNPSWIFKKLMKKS